MEKEKSNVNNIDMEQAFRDDAIVLQKKTDFSAIKSVIKFSCLNKEIYTFPEEKILRNIILKLEKEQQDLLVKNYSNNFFYKEVNGHWYIAVSTHDSKKLIEALNLGSTEFNRDGLVYNFVIAHFNPWNNKKTTTYIFLNSPLWKSKKDAEEFYCSYGKIEALNSQGKNDVVTYESINWKLPFLWYTKYLKNKKKKTKTFQIPFTPIIVKLTSKVRCDNCRGYGHHLEACPKEVLPLLQELQNQEEESTLNPHSKESKAKLNLSNPNSSTIRDANFGLTKAQGGGPSLKNKEKSDQKNKSQQTSKGAESSNESSKNKNLHYERDDSEDESIEIDPHLFDIVDSDDNSKNETNNKKGKLGSSGGKNGTKKKK